jgi:8-oxo-dGTP pyrophosphatase MutT (NUDIX family)
MAEQLFQIGVKGLIRNESGKILMVRIPAWSGNPGHWDLPGGRMDPGETFLQTLKRELEEEIGVSYSGQPQQMAAMLTSITIPVGGTRYPLVFVIYQVELPDSYEIKLDPNSPEEAFEWFTPAEAAEHMAVKFSDDFRDMVRGL